MYNCRRTASDHMQFDGLCTVVAIMSVNLRLDNLVFILSFDCYRCVLDTKARK